MSTTKFPRIRSFLVITLLASAMIQHGALAAAGDRPIEALLRYWTPKINSTFADTYAVCALKAIEDALSVSTPSFSEAELQIGRSCRKHISSTISILTSSGLKLSEAKSLINYIYKDRQSILVDYYWSIANKKLDKFIDQRDSDLLTIAKADHLDCIQKQVAKYAIQSAEPANTVVRAAVGFCQQKENKVAEILFPYVAKHGGDGAATMDEYAKNIADNAAALVLELRTNLPAKSPMRSPKTSGGI